MKEEIYASYPDVYESLYQKHRDYARETDFFQRQYELNARTDDRRALVVGCGTGEHSRELASRGFEVVNVDKHRAMVERTRERSDGAFAVGALPDLPVDGSFGLVLAPYNVLNYVSPEEFEDAVSALVELVADGGVLVFDNENFEDVDTSLTLERAEGDGEYARVHRVSVGDRTADVDAALFVRTADGKDVALDSHTLTQFDDERVREYLRELGCTVETYASGYGISTPGKKFDMTVFVAVRSQ